MRGTTKTAAVPDQSHRSIDNLIKCRTPAVVLCVLHPWTPLGVGRVAPRPLCTSKSSSSARQAHLLIKSRPRGLHSRAGADREPPCGARADRVLRAHKDSPTTTQLLNTNVAEQFFNSADIIWCIDRLGMTLIHKPGDGPDAQDLVHAAAQPASAFLHIKSLSETRKNSRVATGWYGLWGTRGAPRVDPHRHRMGSPRIAT